jgi:hypothetical protein
MTGVDALRDMQTKARSLAYHVLDMRNAAAEWRVLSVAPWRLVARRLRVARVVVAQCG